MEGAWEAIVSRVRVDAARREYPKNRTPVASREAAMRIMRDLGAAADGTEAAGLMAIIDGWHTGGGGTSSRTTTAFTGAVARGTEGGITYTRNGVAVREITDAASLANLREEALMDGAGEVNVIVNGSNRLFRERVADGASRIVRELEINNGGQPAVVTVLHERFEANLREGMLTGRISSADVTAGLRAVAAAMPVDALPQSDKAGRALRERVPRGAQRLLSEGEARETAVELAVADTIGVRKDGTRTPAGAIADALTSALRATVNPAERAAIGKFRALLRAARIYVRGVMGTVAGLAKARRDGTLAAGNDFDALIRRITGTDTDAGVDANVLAGTEPARADAAAGTGATGTAATPDTGAAMRGDTAADIDGDGDINAETHPHAFSDTTFALNPWNERSLEDVIRALRRGGGGGGDFRGIRETPGRRRLKPKFPRGFR